jgi:Spy/CpxP family protein refolding chaperone
MKKIKAVMVLLSTVLMLSTPFVYANEGGMDVKGEKGWAEKRETRHQELYKELNLTEAQKKSLEENKAKNKDQMKSIFTEMKDKKALIRQELGKDTLDMGKVTQLNNDLKGLQAKMLDYKLERILEVRKILTPEQFKKFTAKMKERGEHFKEKHKEM